MSAAAHAPSPNRRPADPAGRGRLFCAAAAGVCYGAAALLYAAKPQVAASSWLQQFCGYFTNNFGAGVLLAAVAFGAVAAACLAAAPRLSSGRRDAAGALRCAVPVLLFLGSLFPLNWAASFSRSHDSALPYDPYDFVLVVLYVAGSLSLLLLCVRGLYVSAGAAVNRLADRLLGLPRAGVAALSAAAG
ncbi:hypothetical protein ACFL43_06295, partial [Thermodesulfobacteriota bacterium]